jgi:hypothetical protein
MGQMSAALDVLRRALADFWYQWVILLLVNTLWLLGCLTVIFAPPVTFALFYVTNELAHGRGAGYSDFITGLKRYFALSWLWAFINVAAAFLVWVNTRFYGQIVSSWSLALLLITAALAIGWVSVQLLTIPYIIEQERKRLPVAMRNALFTLLATPLFSLTMLVIIGALMIAAASIPIILLLGGPCFITLLCNRAVVSRLQAFGITKRAEGANEAAAEAGE